MNIIQEEQVLEVFKGTVKDMVLSLERIFAGVEFIQLLQQALSALTNFLQHNPIFYGTVHYIKYFNRYSSS